MIMNVPVVDNKSVLWNISDKIYSEFTNLGITLPTLTNENESNGDKYGEMLYFKDKICIVSYGYIGGCQLNIYDGTQWSKLKINGGTTWGGRAYTDVELEEYKDNLYVGVSFNASYKNSFLYKCDIDNNSVTQIASDNTSEGHTFTSSLTKSSDGNILYWVLQEIYGNTAYQTSIYKYDGSTIGKQLVGGQISNAYHRGSFIVDNKLYSLGYNSSTSYNSVNVVDINNSMVRVYEQTMNDSSLTKINHVRTINGKLYGVNLYNELCEIKSGLSYESILAGVKGISPYKDGMLALCSDRKFYKLKLYKKATATLSAGDKILVDNSFAISDNLESIEGGYKVTETGKVEIGIYE